jgi:hypothetical protein
MICLGGTNIVEYLTSLAELVVFLSVGKSPHNWQTPPTQVTRRDTSLTFLHRHHLMSAHKSMSITIDMLLTHFLHWQRMTCQVQQNVAVDWVSTPKSTIMSRLAQVQLSWRGNGKMHHGWSWDVVVCFWMMPRWIYLTKFNQGEQ